MGSDEREQNRPARVDDRAGQWDVEREGWLPHGRADEAEVDVEEWLRQHRARQQPIDPEHEDLLEAEWEQLQPVVRDDQPVWIDLSEVDALYATSAGRGLADTTAKHRAVDVAADHASSRQAQPGQPRPVPSSRERARAAQRWEQNREYVAQQQERRQ